MSALNLFKKSGSRTSGKKQPTLKQSEVALPDKSESVAPKISNLVIAPVSAILHPYVSEKATRLEGMNQYMFKVTRFANKLEVKKAIQNRYKVTVVSVNMINMPSKKRTVGRHVGTKSGFRKAIVTLAEGDSINFAKA